jgi:hypothetical protein
LFRNQLDAFLAAYDEFGEAFLADVADTPAVAPVGTLTAAGERLVDWGRRRPSRAARSCSRSTPWARKAWRHRDRIMDLAVERFERVAAWMRSIDPTLPTPPRLVGRAVIAASWELTSQAVRKAGDTTTETREALAYIWLLGLTGRPQLQNVR